MPDYSDIGGQIVMPDGSIRYVFKGNVEADSLTLNEATNYGAINSTSQVGWQNNAGNVTEWISGAGGAVFVGNVAGRNAGLLGPDGSSDYVLRPGTRGSSAATPRFFSSSPPVATLPAGAATKLWTGSQTQMLTCSNTWKKYTCNLVSSVNGNQHLFASVVADPGATAPQTFGYDHFSTTTGTFQTMTAVIYVFGGNYSQFVNNRCNLYFSVDNQGTADMVTSAFTVAIEEAAG